MNSEANVPDMKVRDEQWLRQRIGEVLMDNDQDDPRIRLLTETVLRCMLLEQCDEQPE
jgi:hypothetical protein